jgi:MinD superfamily P-loop ATPase
MKEVVVLSGKGGTGKTSIVASLASLAQNKVMVDCDVDAADLHLLLNPTAQESHNFYGSKKAHIIEDRCTKCGLCQDVCRFDAITDELQVDPVSCEGCGFCYQICPTDAISLPESLAGNWYVSVTRYGSLVHARLGVGQENSGKLVAQVRQQAQRIAAEQGLDYIISDGPPGIGCPVISSLSAVNLAVIITEPTLSGMHDLDRVIGVCGHFGVPAAVCINKCDLNVDNTSQIEDYCLHHGLNIVGRIAYNDVFTEALAHGVPVVEYTGDGVAQEIKQLWQKIVKYL